MVGRPIVLTRYLFLLLKTEWKRRYVYTITSHTVKKNKKIFASLKKGCIFVLSNNNN